MRKIKSSFFFFFFFCCLMNLVCFCIFFFFFCLKRATGGERVWNFAAFYHPVVRGSFFVGAAKLKVLFTA